MSFILWIRGNAVLLRVSDGKNSSRLFSEQEETPKSFQTAENFRKTLQNTLNKMER